jgi:hypothetical protein
MSETEEKRQQPRIPVNITTKVSTASGLTVTAQIVDLSVTGAAIRFEAPGEKGSRLKLDFQLNTPKKTFPVSLTAVVIHNHLKDNHYIIGTVFLEPDQETRNLLASYIEHVKEVRRLG